jgi:hypothetical protein
MTKALLRARRISVVSDIVYLYRDRPGGGSMTAAAGELPSVDSYFRQESECSVLVAGQMSSDLSREYTSIILAADGYVHLARALRGVSSSDDTEPISRHVAEIFRNLDLSAADDVRPERQWLFALAGLNEWEASRDLLALLEAKREPKWSAEAIITWLSKIGTAVTPRASTWMINRFLLPRFVKLSADRAADLAKLALPLSQLFHDLRSNAPELGRTPLQRRVAAAVCAGSVADIATEMTRTTLRARARGAKLSDGIIDLSFRLPIDATEAAIAARHRSGSEIELVALDTTRAVHAVQVRLRDFAFSRGAWALFIRAADSLGSFEVPLTLTGAVSSESRLSRWALVPRRQRPREQVLVMRDSLSVRALRRARRSHKPKTKKDQASSATG